LWIDRLLGKEAVGVARDKQTLVSLRTL